MPEKAYQPAISLFEQILSCRIDSFCTPNSAAYMHNRVTFIQKAAVPASILLLWFILSLLYNQTLSSYHFSLQADAFLHGRLWLESISTTGAFFDVARGDVSFFNGYFHLPFGPTPSVLLLPFVPLMRAVGSWDIISYVMPLLNFFNVLLVYSLARRLNNDSRTSLWLTLLFICGSAYIGVSFFPVSSYYTHVLSTSWILLSLLEFTGRKRWWVIGMLLGLAFSTRVTAGFGILFFFLSAFDTARGSSFMVNRDNIIKALKLIIPFALFFITVLLYNYVRFGSALETGYSFQIVGPPLNSYLELGTFHYQHILKNLSVMLLNLPQFVYSNGSLVFPFIAPNPIGMSLLLTTPFLLVLLAGIKKIDWLTVKIAMTTGVLVTFFLFLFSSGEVQFGYRFSLDFLPYLFLLFCILVARGAIRLTKTLKTLIIASAIFNLYMVSFGLFFIS